MLYTEAGDNLPGSSLGVLTGSLNPATAGTYTYTPASNLTLSSSTDYYIVLTAGTTVANGSYQWDIAPSSISYNQTGGWNALHALFYSNDDGSSWIRQGGLNPQFAINATAVPEPSPSFLLLLGSGVFIYVRRAFHR
jgi:hypothetical protein